MGGTLELESTLSHGCLFKFKLTVESLENTTQSNQVSDKDSVTSTSNAVKQRLKDCHLLIVDDDPINQELAKIFLEREGATIELACNGVEAVETINIRGAGSFFAILMDVQMPKMDGIEATQKIRALENTYKLPIIGLSAYIRQSEIERMIKAGMNNQVSKPINFLELIGVLESLKLSN